MVNKRKRVRKVNKKRWYKRINQGLVKYKWLHKANKDMSQDYTLTMRRSMIKELLLMKQGHYYYFKFIGHDVDMNEAITPCEADYKFLKKLGLIKVVYSQNMRGDPLLMDDSNVSKGCTLTKMGRRFVNAMFPEYKAHYPKAKAGSVRDHILNQTVDDNVANTISYVINRIKQVANIKFHKLDDFKYKLNNLSRAQTKRICTKAGFKNIDAMFNKQHARYAELIAIYHLSEIGAHDAFYQLKQEHRNVDTTELYQVASKKCINKMHDLFHGKNAVTQYKVDCFLANHIWKSLEKDHHDYILSSVNHRLFYNTSKVSQEIPLN